MSCVRIKCELQDEEGICTHHDLFDVTVYRSSEQLKCRAHMSRLISHDPVYICTNRLMKPGQALRSRSPLTSTSYTCAEGRSECFAGEAGIVDGDDDVIMMLLNRLLLGCLRNSSCTLLYVWVLSVLMMKMIMIMMMMDLDDLLCVCWIWRKSLLDYIPHSGFSSHISYSIK